MKGEWGMGKRREPRDHTQSEAARKRRLQRLAAVRIRCDRDEAQPSCSPVREAVLQAFRSKARAVGLTDTALREVVHRVLVHEVRAKKYLVAPGDAPAFVSVVGVGAIKTKILSPVALSSAGNGKRPGPRGSKPNERWLTVQFAKPGYIAGLTPTTSGPRVRKFAAVAHCHSVVAELPRDVIAEVLKGIPARVRLQMMAYHWRGLSRLIAEQSRLLSLDTEGRLRCVLSELARDFPHPGRVGAIALELHHDDLAQRIGKERTGVLRALKKLQGDVWFDRTIKRYVVHPHLLQPATVETTAMSPSMRSGIDAADSAADARALSLAARHIGLPGTVHRMLSEGAELRTYQPDDLISIEDPLHLIVLLSGAARVSVDVGRERQVGVWIAKPGHFIGAGWVGSTERQSVFRAVAHDTNPSTGCRVAILKEDLLLRVMDALAPFEMLTFLGRCHDVLSRQLYDRTTLLPLNIPERLLYQLHVLAADFPDGVGRGTIVDLPLTRRDLALLIAATKEQVGSALADLEEAGRIVRLKDQRILVLGLFLAQSAA